MLSPEGVFQRVHGTIVPFVARRQGRVTGRIAAIVNRSHNAFRNEKVGHFGFFDCENDPGTARALFAAAEEVFLNEGLDTARGPYNPSIHDDCGLLVEGFDTPSTVFMPQNPAYYESLITGLGYVRKRDLYAFLIPLAPEAPPRLKRIIDRITRSSRLRMRDMDMSRMDDELQVICRLYNATLDRNFGYYPISIEELRDAAQGLAFFADPRLIQFVEIDGRPVGFTLVLPNIHEVLLSARNRRGWLRLAEVLVRIKFQKMNRMRMAILGVDPEFRDRGLGAWMYCKMFERGYEIGYKEAETSWIDEDNEDILRAIDLMGCKRDKKFRLYERSIQPKPGD